MKKRLTFILLMAIATITCQAQSEKRLALVVGNSEYLGKGNSLANPAHDAEDVSAKLKTLGFDVTTLIDGSLLQMKDAINLFSSKAKDYDIAFFYYSGHGLQTKGSNYMMPVDAEPSTTADIEYECYPLNRLLDKLDESNCPMKIIVLDACRNNPFTKGWYRGNGEEGLASVQSPKGTFITFATAAGSVAYDGTGRNSPYTTAFLQTLDTPNLSLFEFFNTVGQLVLEETQNKQDPWVNYSTMKGSFYFNKKATPAPAVTSAQSSPAPPTDTKSESLTFTVNGVSFVMKRVEGGAFWMGAQNTDPDGRNYDSESLNIESPVHKVILNSFYIGETVVTQALWKAVMGNLPTSLLEKPTYQCDNCPIVEVSWEDCYEFITKLNKLTNKNFHLPTEAEWEYAARGGQKSKGFKYSGSNYLKDVSLRSSIGMGSVKVKYPNELGIYDMTGKVWQWCNDFYDKYSNYEQNNPNPQKTNSNNLKHIMRGGSYIYVEGNCRVSFRYPESDNYKSIDVGFRLALSE